MYKRLFKLPKDSFFLLGPRNTGKSTLLNTELPKNRIQIDLLNSETFLEFSRHPERLEEICKSKKNIDWIWIDEVQKIPMLLEEVHRLIEKYKFKFALSGSSARKLKRQGANLLAARATLRHMEGFVHAELNSDFDAKAVLEFGSLPALYNQREPVEFLADYLNLYIKEEIRAEGLVRNLDPFLRFLEVAGLMNGQILNATAIANDAKVPRMSVENYFSILTDTMVGYFLPAYRPQLKVKETAHPRFFWFDCGVARAAAGLLRDTLDSFWLGFSLETYIFHELRVYNRFSEKERPLFYYGVTGGGDIDFVIETRKGTLSRKAQVVLIEIKYSKQWKKDFSDTMLSFANNSKVDVKGMFGVYLGNKAFERDGVLVLPVMEFLARLYSGEIY